MTNESLNKEPINQNLADRVYRWKKLVKVFSGELASLTRTNEALKNSLRYKNDPMTVLRLEDAKRKEDQVSQLLSRSIYVVNGWINLAVVNNDAAEVESFLQQTHPLIQQMRDLLNKNSQKGENPQIKELIHQGI